MESQEYAKNSVIEIGTDIRNWIRVRHFDWWNFLLHAVLLPQGPDFNITEPEIKFHYLRARWAGRANGHWCKYSVPHALVAREKYDSTIAHEVCHSFAHRLVGFNAKHGALWHYLFQTVCGFTNEPMYWDKGSVEIKHVKLAKKLREIDKIKEQLSKLE
jgi:hypothetical protein